MRKSEVMRTARNTLAGHWFQGDYTDNAGRFCALGGLAVAMGQTDGIFDSIEAEHPESTGLAKELQDCVVKVIRQQYPEYTTPSYLSLIVKWNDAEGRTENEVLAVFDKAALQLEEQEASE
jgi:hypothetical protein